MWITFEEEKQGAFDLLTKALFIVWKYQSK
jgi:hypothetical protein